MSRDEGMPYGCREYLGVDVRYEIEDGASRDITVFWVQAGHAQQSGTSPTVIAPTS